MNKKKRLALLLACAILGGSTTPVLTSAAMFADTTNHWAAQEIDEWSNLNIIQGYDGMFNPNSFITRADFSVILDRVMQYQEDGTNTFSDLAQKYYTEAILRANEAGIIQGSNNQIRPEDQLTREEAAVMIARAFNITETKGNTSFLDDADISSWAIGTINTMEDLGYISGRTDNTFAPKASITRAEIIKLLDNITAQLYNAPGTYSKDISGNVIVSSKDVILEDMKITGDLILAEGIAEGDLTLNNVQVTGDVYAKGGGNNSIYFNDTTVGGSLVVRKANGNIRIVITGATTIDTIELRSGATIIANDLSATGKIDTITIPADSILNQKIMLEGDFDTVENNLANLEMKITGLVKNLILNADTTLTGAVEVIKVHLLDGVTALLNGAPLKDNDYVNTDVSDDKEHDDDNDSDNDDDDNDSDNDDDDHNNDHDSDNDHDNDHDDDDEATTPQLLTITFEGNGATTTPSALKVESGDLITLPSNPSKLGYVFGGWYTDHSLTMPFDPKLVIESNMTLYARWIKSDSEDLVTVSFYIENTTTPDAITVEVGDVITLPTMPTKPGYTLDAWYLDRSFTQKFNEATPITKDLLLYGQWEKNKLPEQQILTTNLPNSPLNKPNNNRWATVLTENINLTSNEDLQVVKSVGDVVMIHTYSPEGEELNVKTLQNPLELFGGFYQGETYNYIVYGQENLDEIDTLETIRVVKYDKSFNEVDALSLTGADIQTVAPFDAGSLRMDESDNELLIHTSRTNYKHTDGLNHQSQLTLHIDTTDMTLLEEVTPFPVNHVSHSFNQFVHIDGTDNVFVDHGDAYPRSIVLHKGNGSHYEEVDLFKIPGLIGANATGVSIGGFELSDDHYIVAFNTINHDLATNYDSFGIEGEKINQRHVMLAVVPKDNLSESAVLHIELSDYTGTDKGAYPPHLVKVNDNHFVVMWEEYTIISDTQIESQNTIKYLSIDGNGDVIDTLHTIENMQISNCQPIVVDDSIVWITDENETRTLYRIHLQ